MKVYTAILTLAIIGTIFPSSNTFGQAEDAVKKANAANEKKADKGILDDDDAEFIVKSVDARMMDAREGKLAIKQGTSSAIKDYGKLMVKDQDVLLSKLKALAKQKKITVPETISKKKEDGREDLAKESGKDFDKKFVKMMIVDHERDIKIFKKALDSKDPQIKSFASEYLPMITKHLDGIKAIKDAMK